MKIKLFLLFTIMDLLTLLAYPAIFVYGKLRQSSKPKESMAEASLLTAVSAASIGSK